MTSTAPDDHAAANGVPSADPRRQAADYFSALTEAELAVFLAEARPLTGRAAGLAEVRKRFGVRSDG